MKSYPQLKKQLKGLVLGMRQCNYIPHTDRMDILQDSWVKIIEKMQEGVLEDDYDKIKGYTFLIVRNFCLSFHNKNRLTYTDNLDTTIKWEEPVIEDEMDKEKYKSILLECIEHPKFTKIQRELMKMLLEDKTEDEIKSKLNLKVGQMGSIKYNMIQKMKTSVGKRSKYVLKNHKNKIVHIPCFSRSDIEMKLDYQYSIRQIDHALQNNFNLGDYYIIKMIN
jgi:DNA-directed RNA polymerase specialized sigma24 family protein